MEIGERFPERVTRPVGPIEPPFDPNSIAGLKGWWKADAMSLSNGQAVDSWTDSSGNNNHATATAAARPTFRTNMRNGKPALQFIGANLNKLTLTAPFVTAGGWTIFSVTKLETATVPDICALGYSGADASAGPLNNGGSYYMGHNGWYQSIDPSDQNWHVVAGSTTPQLFVDGVTIAGTQISTTASFNFDNMGMRFSANHSTGYIAEVLAYEGILAAADITKVNNYLTGKYALTYVPPTVDPPPGGVLGLKAYWRADSLTLADGDPVPTWMSYTTPNFIFQSPGNGTTAPTFRAGVLNGKPVVRFNGTSDGMQMTVSNVIAGMNTAFVVFKEVSGYPYGYGGFAIMAHGFSSSHPWGLGTTPEAGPGLPGMKDASGGMVIGPVPITGEWHFLSGVEAGAATSRLFVDGAQVASGSLPNPGVGQIALGTMATYLVKWAGDIAEILVYNGVLSDADRKTVETYLSNKYGIPFAVPGMIPGLKGWWDAGKITAAALLRAELKEALKEADLIRPMPAGVEPTAAPADGTGVTVWKDVSGNGYDLAPYPGPGNTPFYKTNILNGKPVVRFDGVISALFRASVPVSQPTTWVFVTNETNKALQNVLKWDTGGQIVYLDTSGFLQVYAGTGANDTIDHSGAFHIFTVIYSGGSVSGYVDGVLRIGPVACGTNPVGNLMMGTTGSGVNAGDVAEGLLYDSALSTTDRQAVENYLKAKYGL